MTWRVILSSVFSAMPWYLFYLNSSRWDQYIHDTNDESENRASLRPFDWTTTSTYVQYVLDVRVAQRSTLLGRLSGCGVLGHLSRAARHSDDVCVNGVEFVCSFSVCMSSRMICQNQLMLNLSTSSMFPYLTASQTPWYVEQGEC